MAENLKVTHYRNGDSIPHVTDSGTWGSLSSGAYCQYNNDAGNVGTYGRLYNAFAVRDSRSIAPSGWHIPTDTEWKELERYLGMTVSASNNVGWRGSTEGGKLKALGYWWSPNTGATNESGFSGLPNGWRNESGGFQNMGGTATYWTSTTYNSISNYSRKLSYDQ